MKILITALSLFALANSAYAAETMGEKASAKANNAKRSVKETVHRGEEKICDKTDKNCLAKRANNRTSEAKDYAKDKASETENMIRD